jgi:hypothetical protein
MMYLNFWRFDAGRGGRTTLVSHSVNFGDKRVDKSSTISLALHMRVSTHA